MRMTQQRINRLKRKIQDARGRLLDTNPFFALVLMHLGFYATRDIRTISTNGFSVFFCPDFMDKLYPEEVEFLLCHILLHIVFDDVNRSDDLKGEGYHHACDMINNDILRNYGYKKHRYPHFGEIYDSPDRWLDGIKKTPLNLYRMLPYNLSYVDKEVLELFLIDTETMWGRPLSFCKDYVRILRPDQPSDRIRAKHVDDSAEGFHVEGLESGSQGEGEGGEGEEEGSSQELGRLVEATLRMLEENGKMQGSSQSLLNDREWIRPQEAKVDWRELLIDFVQGEMMDYSFTPPDRRMTDSPFFLPDFNVPEEKVRDVLFMVDTSGSIRNEMIRQAYGEISGAIEQFNGNLKGWIGFFDTKVVPPVPFDGIEDLKKIRAYGGGGTSFRAVFRYLEENMDRLKPSCIVIMTDGFGGFPEESAAMGVPVLWLLGEGGREPPWGRVVFMNESYECDGLEIKSLL